MDIKAKVEEIVAKVKNDPALAAEFKTNPVAAVEKVAGVDLPDDMVNNVVSAVKTKLAGDSLKEGVDSIKNLFNK